MCLSSLGSRLSKLTDKHGSQATYVEVNWPTMSDWIEEGAIAPGFELPSDGDSPLTLTERRGAPVILFFYPRDDTPG